MSYGVNSEYIKTNLEKDYEIIKSIVDNIF